MLEALRHVLGKFAKDPKGTFLTVLHTYAFMLWGLRGTRRFESRQALFEHSMQNSLPDGLILEFGVAQGASINLLASLAPNEIIYGFDSFQGLPENWGTLPQGHFKAETKPSVKNNVRLVVGLFQDTLVDFLDEHEGSVRFLHLDADLYSSTIFILRTLIEKKRILEGTVIQFDELFCYRYWWKDGEFKALEELKQNRQIAFQFIGYSLEKYGPGQVSILIKNRP